MVLSDRDIKRYIEEERLIITPMPEYSKQLGSCSIDLRLGEIENQRRKIESSEFCLAITKEYIEMPDDICGMLHGKSSLGRKGLMIHSTAPLIDAGFKGKIVLELFNAGSDYIELKEGMNICAVSFEQLSTPAEIPYYRKANAKYLKQSEDILKS